MLKRTLIKSIAIPNSVKNIDEKAFYDCKLKNVDISEDSELTTIGNIAFNQNPIKKFNLPPLMKTIKANSLCSNIKEITVSPKNKYLSVINGNIIVSKSDISKDKYDTILYALRTIKTATIPSYIKKIADEAFRYCYYLREIHFLENSELEIIGKFSFGNSDLKTITIPDHVRIIDDHAFDYCSMKKFNFTENSELEIIGINAIPVYVKNLIIPKTVKTIGNILYNNFVRMHKYTKIEFEADSLLQNLGSYAFQNCRNKSIVIPKHVKEINDHSFYNSNIKIVTFPEDSELQIIKNQAFAESKICSINFPSQLKELEIDWAEGIKKLTSISISDKNHYFKYIDGDKIIAQKSNPNDDKYDTIVFALRDINHAIIPPYIKKICRFAFAHCRKLESIEFSENSELEIIDDYAFYKSKITKINIPKNVKIIGAHSFDSSSLQTIEFQENSELNFIGKFAFSSTKINKFVFPNNNITIRFGIFEFCSKLKEIVLPDSIDTLYPILNKSIRLEKIYIPPKANDLWFVDLSELKEIHISPKNKIFAVIGGQIIIQKSNPYNDTYDIIYNSSKKIEHVIIPSYIKTIGQCAFQNCENINSFEFSENSQLETIESSAFINSSITKIIIPENVKLIEESAFNNCSKLQTVEISRNVSIIERQSFFNCENLKEVTFAKDCQLKSITEELFLNTSIENIVIPKHVQSIGVKAFGFCPLFNITFEEQSILKTIKRSAFYKTGITELKLPGTVEKLEPGWCKYMNQLKEVSFTAPNHHFKVLDNKIILGKSKHIFDSVLNEDDDTFDVLVFAPRDIVSAKIPSEIRFISSYAFSGCFNLDFVTFEKNSKLEEIQEESFTYSSIKHISIPKNVKLIDVRCFSYCTKLSKIEFDPDSKMSIDYMAFNEAPLKGIIVPKVWGKIDNSAFGYSSILNSVEFLCERGKINFNWIETVSFPNAHLVFLHSLEFDKRDEVRIFIKPLGRIHDRDKNHDYSNDNSEEEEDNHSYNNSEEDSNNSEDDSNNFEDDSNNSEDDSNDSEDDSNNSEDDSNNSEDDSNNSDDNWA